MTDRWVNAVIEITVPLERVTCESTDEEKMVEVERLLEAFQPPTGPSVRDGGIVVMASWEDAQSE